jgi:hypothetical protein
MVVIGGGFPALGNTSKVLGPNVFVDTFDLTFADANAVGFDAFVGPARGNVLISMFSPTNQLLGTTTIAPPLGGTFFGVMSDAGLIGRINVAGQVPALGELIDNLAFGVTVAETVPEVPTLTLVAIGLVATVVLGCRRSEPERN